MITRPGQPDRQKNRHRIHQVLGEVFAEATAEGRPSVRIKAADLRAAAGSDIPVEACCRAMVREMGRRDRIEATPPKGIGDGLIIRYALPRRSGGRLPRSFFSRLMG